MNNNKTKPTQPHATTHSLKAHQSNLKKPHNNNLHQKKQPNKNNNIQQQNPKIRILTNQHTTTKNHTYPNLQRTPIQSLSHYNRHNHTTKHG